MDYRFQTVFPNLDLDHTDRALLERTEITRITASEDRTSLTVYLKQTEEVPRLTVQSAEQAIREKIFGGKNIRVSIIVTNPEPQGGAFGGNGYGGGFSENGAADRADGTHGGNAAGNGSRSGRSQTGSSQTGSFQIGGSHNGSEKAAKKPGQAGFKRSENQWTPKQDKKSQNPDIIYGYDFKGTTIPIHQLEDGMGEVAIQGRIFGIELVKTRNEKYIFKFNLTDGTDSVSCRLFCDENAKNEIEGQITKGKYVMLTGTVEPPNQFSADLTVGRIKSIKKAVDPSSSRMDDYAGEKRVELNLHTKMSDMDGIGDIGAYIKLADKWGWKALAITDTNSVQAFPTAAHALPKDSRLKLIYGITGSLIDDQKDAVIHPRGQSLDGEFIVFDIETTGFSEQNDRIIEIGAVRIRGGSIIDRFSQFIDPERLIPPHITALTTITDEMVRGQGNYEYWIPKFLEFVGDWHTVPVVGHNAMFDVGFIRANARRLGLEFDPTVVDTLGLSHMLLKHLFRNKLDNVAKELGVTLSTHHRAVDDAGATAGIFLNFVRMLKSRGIENLDQLYEADEMDAETIKKLHGYAFTILAKNDLGRTNLYRLVSASHIDYFNIEARMPRSLVDGLRDGLLIGSGNEESELYDAVFRGLSDEALEELVSFYDYLEVMPPENLRYLIQDGMVPVESMGEIEVATRRIVELGKKLGKPVIASGNVHFSERGESIYRTIIKYFEYSSKGRGDKFPDEKYGTELYLRTTEEMLEAFRFLGEETARELVIDAPGRIADQIERIAPVRPDKCPPVIENSDKELETACYNTARAMYGEILPDIVKTRLDKELHSIISNGYSVMYIIAKRLVQDSMEHGFLVGSRGSVGSSLAATFGGISEVNPLPPHYRCSRCHYVDFDSETVREYKDKTGYDLPDRICPKCGAPLIKDGFDIPFETFLGFKGDKEPDIDLNFAGEYQPNAHAYTEVLFGEGQTYKAGTIGTVQEKTAYGYVLRYNEDHAQPGQELHMRRAEIERLAMGCTEVRRTTGQHPGGIVVLPHGEEMSTFTPIQHPANVMTNPITTHLDYHSIDHNLLKLDILGKDDPSMVRQLQDLTGLDPMEIPVGTPEVMSLFANTESLGITPEDIGGTKCGTMGVPEFGTDFAMQMLLEAKPKYVSDLVRIAGLAHGTDVWLGNAQKLISEGTCTIQTAICTRDDIMIYLIDKGLDPGKAFKIMELVRKGKFPKDGGHEAYCQEMREHGVPDWYIWSCDTIKYMFPKAHAAAYVVMSLRIAYYKVHHPLAYYAAYYTVKADGFSYEKMCVSLPKLRANLAELREYMAGTRDATGNEKNLYRDMRIVEEMMARGYEFEPIDIFKARAKEFTITENGKIMPALNSIDGLGDNAAEAIAADVQNGPYLSVEEFISRTRVTKTNADLLKSLGLLGSIPESNQLSLFDLF